jgi:N-acetylmuramoyl-L-alanine amidase
MIATAILALQLAASARASHSMAPLVLRDAANHSATVPLVASDAGPMLRPESLARWIAVAVRRDGGSRYTVTVGDVPFEVEAGATVVRVAGVVRQLATPPVVRSHQLLVPLQFVSEVVTAFVPNTRWDAEAAQLVLFTSFAHASARRGSSSPAPPASPRRATRPPGADATARGPAAGFTPKHERRTIIVDAGHGGPDNGMTGPMGSRPPRLYEKNVTLAVAKRLGKVLSGRGVDVVYTRTTDTLIALDDRGRIANKAGGDLFISIHVNAASPSWKNPAGARGFETYFLSEARTEDARRVEQMENEVVRFEGATAPASRDDPLGFILNDMAQNEHLRESNRLAELIQARIGRMHPGPSRGVKQAGFRVLVTAYMPAVLVEIGFGSNAREADFLLSKAKQGAIANAVADAAMEYLQSYERRVAGPEQ